MKYLHAVPLGALLLAACATTPPTPQACGQRPTDQQAAEHVQTYIANINWKDPDSVRVRNIQVQSCRSIRQGLLIPGGPVIGWEIDFEINATNSYGGHTGFQARSITASPDGKIHWDPESQ